MSAILIVKSDDPLFWRKLIGFLNNQPKGNGTTKLGCCEGFNHDFIKEFIEGDVVDYEVLNKLHDSIKFDLPSIVKD